MHVLGVDWEQRTGPGSEAVLVDSRIRIRVTLVGELNLATGIEGICSPRWFGLDSWEFVNSVKSRKDRGNERIFRI